MSDLRPLGSEKLTGDNKIKRILEIANFKNNVVEEKNITESVVTLADGKTYGIEREKLGYIIKVKLDESETFEYRTNIKNRKYHKSYSQALKEMNLLAKELNRLNEQDQNIDLFNEQKKFVLKTPEPVAPPAEELPADDLGGEEDLGFDMDVETPEGEEDLGFDMDLEAPEGEEDMDLDMDMAPEGDEEEATFKSIQKLTGKLGQKLRTLESQQGLTSEEIKYVLNSIISAVSLENLTEEDKDDILENFEEEVEYDDIEGDIDIEGGEDDLDLGFDDFGGEDLDDELPSEPLEMVMDEIFSESKAEKVISKYYDEEVNNELNTKSYLKETMQKVKVKKEINRLSESIEQQLSAEQLVNENKGIKLVGRTNLKNLIFESDNGKFKVTTSGEIL